MTDMTSEPNLAVTNAQMLTFLVRSSGETVTGDSWQQSVMNWADKMDL